MLLALQSFCEIVTGCRVTAMCNNSMVVAYVNKQGRTKCRSPCSLAGHLVRWTESLDVHLVYEVSTGSVQCPVRSPQSSWSGYRDSVVSPPAGGKSASSCLGLLVARPGSPGSLQGYVLPSLGQPGRLRISTLSSHRWWPSSERLPISP